MRHQKIQKTSRQPFFLLLTLLTLLLSSCNGLVSTPPPDTTVPDSTTGTGEQATIEALQTTLTAVAAQTAEQNAPTSTPATADTDTPTPGPMDETLVPTALDTTPAVAPATMTPLPVVNNPPASQTVRIGRATWETGWFQAELYKQLLQELGYTVDGPRTYDNQEFYLSAAGGIVDLWPNGWYPLHTNTIEDEKIQGTVSFVGMEVKSGALQGYLIDQQTADELAITSLEDFTRQEVIEAFDRDGNGKADLIGCNFGWGCEQVIEHHLDAYDLRETVEHVQGEYDQLMTETLERYEAGEPVFYYTWTPNWTVGKLVPGEDVVWLEVPFASLPADQQEKEDQVEVAGITGCVDDPCLIGFPPNDIRVAANTNFLNAHPGVNRLLELVEIPPMDIAEQNSRMFDGEDSEADIAQHAQEWITQNRNLVDQWLADAEQVAASTTPITTTASSQISTTAVALTIPTPPPPPAPASDALVLRMLYSSDKQPWVEHVTRLFNAQEIASTSGRPIYIDAIPMGSVESMDKIISGQEQADIWSPASSMLFPLANQRWGETHAGNKLVQNASPMLLSPVVIAMWQPMAEAMGWPQQQLGWSDIAEFASSGKTWEDYGHAEWGAFKFGHTHPEHSSSGLITIMAMAHAAAGKTRGLSEADVQQPDVSQLIADVESSVIHYGESTGFFGRQMIAGGPSYLSAAVLHENLVIESYDKEQYPERGMPIVAIYPREGTFWANHPFAILPAALQDEERRAAAQSYQDFLLAQPQQELALNFGFRPIDQRIAIGGIIHPSRGVNPNQPTQLIEVPPAEVMQAVRNTWSANKKRVEVLVLLDTSGSMNMVDPPENLVRITEAREGLKAFINQLADDDRMGLITFNFNAAVVSPLGEIGPKREEVKQRIDSLFADGGTRLIDTLQEAYEELSQEPPGEYIRAIVVLSDGADTTSMNTQDELLRLIGTEQEGYSIKIYTIAYGMEGAEEINHDLLQAIAEASGGEYYESDPATIEEVYLAISRFF
jgi:Ca-activated chloride channel family protein